MSGEPSGGGSSAATRCGLSRAPVSVAILLAVGVGVVLAYGFYWVIGGFVGTKEDEPAAKIDVYKTALAGVAGVAGIRGAVALVVAYRRQRDAEQGRFVERFGAAAARITVSSPGGDSREARCGPDATAVR